MMSLFEVRVTRSTDQEWADIAIRAETWEEAKRLAIEEADRNEHSYFGSPAEPAFYVDPMDDDPNVVEEE